MEAIAVSAGVVFLAEFGDKSQLLALTMATRHRWTVVALAVVCTAVATTAISALAGGVVRAVLPPTALDIGAGLVFVGFAVVTLRESDDEPPEVAAPSRRTALSLIGALVVAELGDKTMFATAGLAAELGVVGSWLGAAIGMAAAGLLGVFVGARLGAVVPRRPLRLAAAGVFLAVGVSFLIGAW